MGHVVSSSTIAEFLGTDLYGKDIEINKVASVDNITENTVVFSKKSNVNDISALALVPLNFEGSFNSLSIIKVDNPRLAFAKVIDEFFMHKKKVLVHKSACIGDKCHISSTVSIGANCVIGDNVTIGEHTVINSNVVISDNTYIGKYCYLKSGSVIGEDGFGFDFETNAVPVRIPHIGKVVIGDYVEVGSKNTIARGSINDTVVNDHVKLDDQVHIAHNCNIGSNSLIAACSEISGSVTIGKNCWIGPNSSIIQKIKVGDSVTIGIGSIVTKNIESRKKVMGFNALDLRSLLKLKKRIEYGE